MKLTIRVGAAADRSLSEAYRPLLAAGEKARAALARGEAQGAAARTRATKQEVTERERTAKQMEAIRTRSAIYAGKLAAKQAQDEIRAAKQEAREQERIAKQREAIRTRSAILAGKVAAKQAADEVKAAEKAAKESERATERSEKAKTRAAAKELAERRRNAEKADREQVKRAAASARELEKSTREVSGVAKSVGGGAMRTARAAGGLAMSVAGDLARGAGVQLDVGAMFQKNFDLEQQATDLSNAGYAEGSARNGLRTDPRKLVQQTFDVGKATGTDANVVMEGLQKFVAKTGDLATGRDVIEDMARLAKMTGAEMSDVADAAGDVSSALPDTADKGARVKDIMAVIAAQGKMGAVEIKQLATQMTKVAAAAGQFEGDAGQNMIAFGGMAQMARSGKGGAASASQAANTVAAFTATFTKGARVDAFKKFGVNITGEGGKTRDPKGIILDSIAAANSAKFGGPKNANVNMGEMFKDANARKALMGYENIYKEAGGGDKGLQAVSKAFDDMVKAALSERDAMESFRAAMGTGKSQAEVFNQALRETAMAAQNELTPAMLQLAPYVVEGAKAFASAISWITGKSMVTQDIRRTGTNVAAVAEASRKGIATGQVAEGQKELNARATNEAAATVEMARAEVQKAKAAEGSGAKAAFGKVFDTIGPGAAMRPLDALFGSGKGLGVAGTSQENAREKTKNAEANLAAAEKIWQDMHNEQKRLTDLLASGKVVVRQENGPKPPGMSDDGRTPGPGQ